MVHEKGLDLECTPHMWKFCGKGKFLQSFGQIARVYQQKPSNGLSYISKKPSSVKLIGFTESLASVCGRNVNQFSKPNVGTNFQDSITRQKSFEIYLFPIDHLDFL